MSLGLAQWASQFSLLLLTEKYIMKKDIEVLLVTSNEVSLKQIPRKISLCSCIVDKM